MPISPGVGADRLDVTFNGIQVVWIVLKADGEALPSRFAALIVHPMNKTGAASFANLKRRAILDAAMAEFRAKGPDKASLRAIASAAGATTGAIYSMFEGKDDLYAALLAESLDRLKATVATRATASKTSEDRVRAAITAFHDYYSDRLFEVQLGMHSFAGLSHSGLGRERDAALNSSLIETLNIISGSIADLATHLSEAEVEAERNAIFSCLIGVLTLAHTGRAASVGTAPKVILEHHIATLLRRLAPD